MQLRILLIEKDVTTADLLVPGLERKGHRVVIVPTLRQAQQHLKSLRPHMTVVDVASFDERGYAVCDAVRNDGGEIPMILLLPKGHDGAGDRADAYMTPPFTSRKLLYRVNKLARQIRPREIQCGGLILDADTRTLYRNGNRWHLRPKETALLAILMSNEGRVVSRQEIMNKVWKTGYMDDTRTLNVHICWLRNKIEKDPHSPRILRTVRGRGYLFDADSA